MDATSARGGSLLASPSQPPRKEWRAVSETSFQNKETERGNFIQSDERTIYEEGADGELCAVAMETIAGLSDEILQQRLQTVMRQREELQGFEIELRAQAIVRPQIVELQSNFDAKLKEHISANTKLKEQLIEREKYIREIEKKLDDKDSEVRALQIDNETGWPKDDLLREQNKELATFRRERDNTEAERAQHLKQIRDFQELIREKETQLLSLEEQHRAAQEQLREAHGWITRVQEMETFNNNAAQILRERTEHFCHSWMALQTQYAEMERHHMQTIQQLQLELAAYKDGTTEIVPDPNKLINNINNNINNNIIANGVNGNLDPSKKGEAQQGGPIMGVGPTYMPPAQLAYMIHPSQALQTSSIQLGSFQPVPAIIQAVTDAKQQMFNIPNQMDLSKPSEQSQVIEKNNAQAPIQKDSVNSNYTILQNTGVASNHIQELNNNNSNNIISNNNAETDKNGMSCLKGKEMAIPLLDERSVLACIVRAIPPGPTHQIKISSNLPTRLAKMLAPLTWNDYRNHYGQLDDFVSRHPELFVIEGDFIRVREGAQQIIAATTAAARVAASNYATSAFMPPVAVTPVARQKRDHQFGNNISIIQGVADVRIGNGRQQQQHQQQQAFGPTRTNGAPVIARR